MAADHQVGAGVAERRQQGDVAGDPLVGHRDDQLGAGGAQLGGGAPRRRHRVVEGGDVRRVLDVGGETEQAHPDAAAVDQGRAHQLRRRHQRSAVGAGGELEVGPQPAELRLLDPPVEHRPVRQAVLVELVVAEGDEHPRVHRHRVAVEKPEDVDHLGALEGAAEQRREEEVAGVEHQQVGRLALQLAAQGAHPGEAAAGLPVDAADAVDVVDRQHRHRAVGGGGGRRRPGRRPAAPAAGERRQEHARQDGRGERSPSRAHRPTELPAPPGPRRCR